MKITGLKVHIAYTDEELNTNAHIIKAPAQVEEIKTALIELGAKPYVAGYKNSMKKLTSHKDRPDMVFNMVESVHGKSKDMYRAAMFFHNSYYPYTGSSYKSLNTLADKVVMKRVLTDDDVLTPVWHMFGDQGHTFHNGQYIVKALNEVGKFEIDESCVVALADAEEADDKIKSMFPDNTENYFAERYIDSREFNVSVIEVDGKPETLPLAEIVFEGFNGKHKLNCKVKDVKNEPSCSIVKKFGTVDAGSKIEEKIHNAVLKCWQAFNLSGYAVIDIRLDSLCEPYVLDVDAAPGLGKDDGFFNACKEGGYTYNKMIEMILKAAMKPK